MQSFQKVSANPSIDLDRFDPDIHLAIDVLHNPPLIAGSGEKVVIEFYFACKYANNTGSCCNPSTTLFVSYGEGENYIATELSEEDHDSLRVLSAVLPAVDKNGQSLRRYYLQATDPQVGLDVRYPTAGAVDLFVASELIAVDLPAQKPVEMEELVFGLPWGDGSEAAGLQQKTVGYPWRRGPIAMDVADDGRIALLDIVKQRILIFDPAEKGFKVIPVPSRLPRYPDIQFDQVG